MKIIDAHIHPFLRETQNLNPFYRQWTKEDFRRELQRMGVSGAVGSVLWRQAGIEDFSQIRTLNADAFRLQSEWPEFYRCGIHIHPCYPVESCQELSLYREKGVRILGEICPYLMGYDGLLNEGMRDILALAGELGYVVCFHTGSARDIIALHRQVPGLKMVFAHPGYGDEYFDRLQALRATEDTFMDLSGTGIAALGMLEYGVNAIGSEKILFGTDYPIYNPLQYIAGVKKSKLSEREKENILYGNAERLYFQ